MTFFMAYGTLTCICGPMYASKTTELLRRILWSRHPDGNPRPCLVLKPAFDNRYGIDHVISHDGLKSTAIPVDRLPEIGPEIREVFVDEVQFLETPHYHGDFPEEVAGLLARGIDVTVAGLDSDWRARAFPVTARLLAMADIVHKKTAHCTVCGRDAQKTFKRIANDRQVEIGGQGMYDARCNAHWHDHGESVADPARRSDCAGNAA
jgi:thymidine kinase